MSCSGASTYSFMLLAPFRVNLLRRLDLDVRLPLALGKLRVQRANRVSSFAACSNSSS